MKVEKRSFWKRCVLFLAVFFLIAAVFFWTVKESWESTPVTTEALNRTAMAEQVGQDVEISQQMTVEADTLEGIGLDLFVQDPDREGRVVVSLTDRDGSLLCSAEKAYRDLIRDGMNVFSFPNPLTGRKGEKVFLKVHTDGGIWFGYGRTVNAGKMTMEVEITDPLVIGNEAMEGSLVIRQTGRDALSATKHFWPVAFALAGMILLFAGGREILIRKGRCAGWKVETVVLRYKYLLKQLVLRDFKVKYKASVLGILWSFLNPLLMTLVYHLVFSNLFSNQDHFVVYLMTGTVLFSFVSESTSLGLSSIVGNAGLISKVYMPKYVFPISKVLSTAINLLITMIPMLVLMGLSQLRFTKSLLLIPLLVILLIGFCIGLSLILSALMVFFRDTQFLWSVVILMWNFISPVFYPESIIPASVLEVYRLNPLYQFMKFLRTIILNGTSPGPECFGFCLLFSVASMVLGLLVFRRLQRKFAIYL